MSDISKWYWLQQRLCQRKETLKQKQINIDALKRLSELKAMRNEADEAARLRRAQVNRAETGSSSALANPLHPGNPMYLHNLQMLTTPTEAPKAPAFRQADPTPSNPWTPDPAPTQSYDSGSYSSGDSGGGGGGTD
jgi:hypothetical protein